MAAGSSSSEKFEAHTHTAAVEADSSSSEEVSSTAAVPTKAIDSTVTFMVELTKEQQQQGKIEIVAVGEKNEQSSTSFGQDEDGYYMVTFQPLDIDQYPITVTADGTKNDAVTKMHGILPEVAEQCTIIKVALVIGKGDETVILDSIVLFESQVTQGDIRAIASGEKTGDCLVRTHDEDELFCVNFHLVKPDKYKMSVTVDNNDVGNSPYIYEIAGKFAFNDCSGAVQYNPFKLT